MNCPKCNTYLKLKIPRKSNKGLKGAKVICKCGYKSECIDWNEYMSRWKEIKKIQNFKVGDKNEKRICKGRFS